MTGAHPEIGTELWQLAQTILDRLDPAVRLAASRAMSGAPVRCQQVWCPVCALAALVAGEQHPLLTVVAEHSVALFGVVRAMADSMGESRGASTAAAAGTRPRPPAPAAPSGPDDEPPPAGPGRYEHIPVTVEE